MVSSEKRRDWERQVGIDIIPNSLEVPKTVELKCPTSFSYG